MLEELRQELGVASHRVVLDEELEGQRRREPGHLALKQPHHVVSVAGAPREDERAPPGVGQDVLVLPQSKACHLDAILTEPCETVRCVGDSGVPHPRSLEKLLVEEAR